MFSEFENYLNLEFLVDYWYDEGIDIASAMLANFDEQDWDELKKQCVLGDSAWQIRCAEVLDIASHPTSKDVLLEFLHSNEEDVVVAAADSLRSKGISQLPLEVLERLTTLSRDGSAPVKAVLGKFLGQLRTT